MHLNRTMMHRPEPRGPDLRFAGRLPGRNCHFFRSARGSCGSYRSSPSSHLGIHSSSPHGLSALPPRRPHSQAGPAASYQRARQATRSRKPAARPRCLFRASLRSFWQWRNRVVGELAGTTLLPAQTMCDSYVDSTAAHARAAYPAFNATVAGYKPQRRTLTAVQTRRAQLIAAHCPTH